MAHGALYWLRFVEVTDTGKVYVDGDFVMPLNDVLVRTAGMLKRLYPQDKRQDLLDYLTPFVDQLERFHAATLHLAGKNGNRLTVVVALDRPSC